MYAITFFQGYECGRKNEENDKELVKKDFLKTSTLLNKAKKTVRDTDWHLKRLSEKVLPRCQSADITCDRIKRLLRTFLINYTFIFVLEIL